MSPLLRFVDRYPLTKVLVIELWLYFAFSAGMLGLNQVACAVLILTLLFAPLRNALTEIVLIALCPALFYYNSLAGGQFWAASLYFVLLAVELKTARQPRQETPKVVLPTAHPAPPAFTWQQVMKPAAPTPARQGSYTSSLAGTLNLRTPAMPLAMPALSLPHAAAIRTYAPLSTRAKIAALLVGFIFSLAAINPSWLTPRTPATPYYSYLHAPILPDLQQIRSADTSTYLSDSAPSPYFEALTYRQSAWQSLPNLPLSASLIAPVSLPMLTTF